MSSGEEKHNRAPKPNVIQYQQREAAAKKYVHGH
jgi:hypothetical protein